MTAVGIFTLIWAVGFAILLLFGLWVLTKA